MLLGKPPAPDTRGSSGLFLDSQNSPQILRSLSQKGHGGACLSPFLTREEPGGPSIAPGWVLCCCRCVQNASVWYSCHNLGCLLSETREESQERPTPQAQKTPKYGYFTHKGASQTCYQGAVNYFPERRGKWFPLRH